MADEFEQYARKTKSEPDEFTQYARPSKEALDKAAEPGWFEPGSKSEAATRGFANAATLGLAPQASAFVNTLMGLFDGGKVSDYRQKEQEYQAADKAAAKANPGSYYTANVAGSLPTMIATGGGSLARQVGTNAALAGINALGSSEHTGLGAFTDAAGGAVAGGAIAGTLGGAGQVISKVADRATKTRAGNNLSNLLADIEIAQRNTPSRVPALEKKLNSIVSDPQFTKIGATDKMVAQEAIEALDDGTKFAGNKLYSDLTNKVIDKTTPGVVDTLKDVGKSALWAGGAAGAATLMGGGDPVNAAENAAKWAAMGGVAGAGKNALIKGAAKLATSDTPEIVSKYGPAVSQYGIESASSALPNPFGAISDYLQHAEDAKNPDVMRAAQEAQAKVDAEEDEAAKRRAAMSLNATPVGRAVTNTDSPIR